MRKRLLRLTALGMSAILAGGLFVGGVAADPGGLPEVEGEGLVEINVPSRDAIDALNNGDWDLAEYVRPEFDGSYTIRVVVDQDGLGELAAMGFGIGEVIEDEGDWLERKAEADATIAAKAAAAALAEEGLTAADGQLFSSFILPPQEVTIMRAVTYEHYAGRYLYVEARTSLGTATGGPTLSMAWDNGDGATFGGAVPMGKFVDTDPNPDVYMYHRDLVRISGPGESLPLYPKTIRVASSVGGVAEAPVTPWFSGGLPPVAEGYLTGFFDHYMDTYELHADIEALAAEYPDLAEVIELPYELYGYQRPAMAIVQGTTNPGSAPSTANQSSAVVLWSKAMGHLGGNSIRVAFTNPGVPSSPLSVTVVGGNPLGGSDITVSLATSATGALSSTAAQVVAAINAHPGASALVDATLWATNSGAGIVPVRAQITMSDFLNAPASVPRGPIKNKILRIGKDTSGNATGIFLYCNQHAREWVTPVTCIETAHRLLENYGLDPATKEFVDTLTIIIMPTSNAGGNIYSRYDNSSQRKTMYNYCREVAPTSTNAMPSGRNSWGVDQNRNNTQYSRFDGYGGADSACNSEVYAGPFEASEPEIQNELWVNNNPAFNIKFANNIHTSGGYFMWAPGSYINAGRITAPAPNIGIEAYFFETADTVLGRIQQSRGTAIPPERTGPIADVLYSAAGNSADEQWYSNGIIAYSFEAGADLHNQASRSTLNQPAAAGDTAIRVTSTSSLAAGDSIMIEPGANQDAAVISSIVSPAPAAPAPNVILATPLLRDHAAGVPFTELTFNGVGFFPNFANEGIHEAHEFAWGNYGLLEGALAYQRDTTAPTVDIVACDSLSPSIDCDPMNGGGAKQSGTWITSFRFGNEPSVIRYTTDGSTPDMSSPLWEAQGPRMPGQFFEFDTTTTVKWFGTDIKGNQGPVRTATFHIDDVDPTIDLVEPQDAGGVGGAGFPGNYALGSEQLASYSCDDDDSGVISCVGTVADGAAFDTSSVGFHSFTVDAEDWAGNTASVTHTYNVYFPGNSGLKSPFNGATGLVSVVAGDALPLKFSLGGVDYGMGIIADGYPRTAQVDCTTLAVTGDWSYIPASGASGFRKTDSSYHYNAKTSPSWAGTCRVLQLKLIDNSVYELYLKF